MKVSESEPSAAAGRHGSQACAACKYQRRKCKPDCPLAPFFPSHDKERFGNVHKLFGVANVTKILQEIPPSFREIAMKCIIYESSARAIAPVGGLGEVGLGLERLIAVHMAELGAVRGQLEAFRAMERANGEGGCDASAQCETTSFVGGGQSSMDECEGVTEVSGLVMEGCHCALTPPGLSSSSENPPHSYTVVKEEISANQPTPEHDDLEGEFSQSPRFSLKF